VEEVDLGEVKFNERGRGGEQYPPRLLFMKSVIGFRRFLLRGLAKVSLE
jgi:hypothetical protein